MPPSRPCFQFNRAMVRIPAAAVVNGLRAKDKGDPDYAAVKREHATYVTALETTGMAVTVLPAIERFPDSIFVEDPALVFTEGAVLLRPGDPRREGEAEALSPALADNFETMLSLPPSGHVDGGDVLVTPRAVLIGLSARTDPAGAEGLTQCLKTLGYASKVVETPKGVLHFKSDCALLERETILVTRRLAHAAPFNGFRKVVVPEGEEPAANAVRINDYLLVSDQYPRTREMLDRKGYKTLALPTREIEKIDAGLSCMSLRWFRD